jgi:signal transduction histidine kinase
MHYNGHTNTYYNATMNLKLYLLIRMTLVGLLCWLGVSIYVVAETGRRAVQDISGVADQLQSMVELDVRQRLVSVGSDAGFPALSWIGRHFPDPLCLRYRSVDGLTSEEGCSQSSVSTEVPHWLARLLTALGPGHVSARREISLWSRPMGVLEVEPDESRLLNRQWHSVRELLSLTAVTLLVLDLLTWWIIGRALRPTAQIVDVVERLGEGAENVEMPVFRPREFSLIASGVNRLADRLAQSCAARAQLTARLIRLQEDERRELAHELHEEFGQSVAALGAVSASLRHTVSVGEALTEADVAPLETGVEHLLSSLRGLLQRMSLPPLEQQGLHSALADLVTAWQIRLHDHPRIELDCEPRADQVPNDERALCAYRVVQECLSNIARHAPDSQTACVYIRQQRRQLYVRVSNDRTGAEESRAASSTGMGLKLLAERVRCLHGSLSVESSATESRCRPTCLRSPNEPVRRRAPAVSG